MPEDRIGPVSLSERIEILDVLRGLAVGGILIGNMQWFSGYGMMPETLELQTPIYDQITHFLVHFFIEGKFYSIFSFLFGFGFALQIARAEDRGDLEASLFKRRLLWLLIIGLLHAYLLWAGDILSIYALVGFVLILFRRKTNGSLITWACILLAVPIFTYILQYILFTLFAPPNLAASIDVMKIERWNTAINTVSQSNFLQILTGYNKDYVIGRYMGLIFDMRLPKILAMFLLGFYAYRLGVFQDLSANKVLIRRVLIWGMSLGIIGNLVFAVLAGHETVIPPTLAGIGGVITYAFGVPALALGIAALVATLWQKESWKNVLTFFAPVGRMALTNYLMQTVICVTIFYGYGFGQFGQFGALTATLIALSIFLVQIILSTLWLQYFAYGPMEWIWRQLTYQKRLSLKVKIRGTD
jgi:uncharacterized protein